MDADTNTSSLLELVSATMVHADTAFGDIAKLRRSLGAHPKIDDIMHSMGLVQSGLYQLQSMLYAHLANNGDH